MKMTTYKLERLLAATAAVLMLAVWCMPQKAQAQEDDYFTLTNGRLWWYEGPVWGSGHQSEVAFDKNSVPKSWAKIWRYNPSNVTHITAMGNVYLRLNIDNPASPYLEAVDTSAFDQYCAWQRTGSTGYYYQLWGNYRYYLVGSPDDLVVVRISTTDPISNTTYWYNWDFGAAMQHVYYDINGKRKTAYHWVMYDDKNAGGSLGNWTISHDSYQRPEDAIYDRRCAGTSPYTGADTIMGCPITSTGHPADDSIADRVFKTYYDPDTVFFDNGTINYIRPNGNGALYMPVKVTGYVKQISDIPDDKGLVSLGIAYNETGASSLRYGQSATATPVMDLTDGAGGIYQAHIRPPYTEYRQEVYRYGLHLDYGERETETFGSAGVPTYRYYYFYDNARHNDLPATYDEDLVISKVNYTLSNSAKRYLSLSAEETNDASPITVSCVSVPPAGAQATLTVKVTYTNGTTETKTVSINISHAVDKTPMPYATNAPVVRGYVVGGGRMANVGGNTNVTVHSCDSIYALYGGNDIAGWVQGADGATIQLGTTKTDADHKVHIGYVYGGGCGFYTYRGINFGYDRTSSRYIYPYDYGNTSLGYQSYYFNGEVYPWGYVPRERTAALHGVACNAVDYDNITPNDTACLHWNWEYDHYGEDPDADGVDRRVVSNFFVYNPLYSDPNDVDNNEDGEHGNGTVPYIKKANITVGVANDPDNDYILIDTMFGGAENAFIGIDAATPEMASSIIVHGGVIYAVFGGNNYGGSIAATAKTVIHINDTKLAPKPGDADFSSFATAYEGATGHEYTGYKLNNTYFKGYGRDWGIRYVYGGGNLVESSRAEVYITGGMVDTCFLGGNRASVEWPVGVVYCTGDNFIYENDSITREWVWKAAGTYEGVAHAAGDVVQHPQPWTLGNLVELEANHRKLYDPSLGSGHEWDNYDNLANHSPGRFNLGIGRYNVRAFFGGNNNAPMNTISRINLWAGGIGEVYGGGNAGDMRSMRLVRDVPDMASRIAYAMDGWQYQWPEVFSCFIHAPGSNAAMEGSLAPYGKSRILCEQVYGGCRMANVKGSTGVWLSGGVFGKVHGGNDISGDVGTETGEGSYVVLDGESLVLQNVYGGSDGFYHCHERLEPKDENPLWGERYMEGGETLVDRNNEARDPYDEFVGKLVPTQNSSNLYIHANIAGKEPKVLYSAYGGGVMTNIGFDEAGTINRIFMQDSADFTGTGANGLTYRNGERQLRLPGGNKGSKLGSVHFQFNGGTVGSEQHHGNGDGNAYGGGYLSSIYGLSYTFIQSTSTIKGSLYTGNDCMGSIASFGAYSIPEVRDYENNIVHEGKNPEDFMATDNITHMNKEDGVDDLGNPKYTATHSAYLRIEGTPTINNVYGSGNGAYNYDGSRPEYSSFEPVCQDKAVDNRPLQKSSFIDINTAGGMIDTVFGGGNGVGVSDEVVVLLNCTTPDVYAVGTIFGGNNRDNMDQCVPDIRLRKGTVDYVFGGGNSGNMNGRKAVADPYCGIKVDSVSTFVRVESADVTVKEAIFGGCRKADVKYMAYVDIRNSNTADGKGINYVYGGNDISGTVHGNTRIDISGGRVQHIYGGSNGRYDYDEINPGEFNVYEFGQPHDAAHLLATGTTGRPFVDSTTLNLWGGQIDDNVYGGGRLGSCRLTYVNVNDRECESHEGGCHDLTINGAVYGGGEGHWENLNLEHQGNVVSTDDGEGYTTVHLHHATNLSTARAYGGGRGGDVENTYIEAFETWDKPFEAIYGGCWGSTVHGTTHVVMRGNTEGESKTAMKVFGGNDFTGYVNEANIRIISGKYDYIYGAGNGDYPTTSYDTGCYAGNFVDHDGAGTLYPRPKRLYVPNTQKVTIDFEGGIVNNNIYGGGKMGTSFPYRRNNDGTLYYDLDGRLEADTNRTAITSASDYDVNNLPFDDPTRYSYLVTNIKGGTVTQNVFGGAAGSNTSGGLVYGLKIVNMQGGTAQDIYGGSENCSDGYWHETCHKDFNDGSETVTVADYQSMTTKRPSSIVNITGGKVTANAYGGGYLGNVYGSAYVNIGLDAVDSCEVWRDPVTGESTAYAVFRPGATGGKVAALTSSNLLIGNSVYGGANWGENSGSADYTAEGFFGGNNWIIVDGERYNYINSAESTDPTIDITKNIIGSGTSAKGGDLKSRIDIRNYGAPLSTDPTAASCVPGKTLFSIQRASELWLHNTAIHYEGDRDAVSAFVSRDFTINRIGTLNTQGYNIMSLARAASNIGLVNFYKEGWPLDYTNNTEFDRCTSTDPTCYACGDNGSVCQQLTMISRTNDNRKLPAFLIHNGVNIDFMDENDTYSEIYGFAYIMAAPQTNAVITAAPKYGSTNTENGGFMPACGDSLQVIASSQGPVLTWVKSTSLASEYSYYNYSTSYRVWSIGQGSRTRFAVVQAHSNPHYSGIDDKPFTIGTGVDAKDYSMAHTTLKLPPTTAGHFYKINGSTGVVITDENEEMRMTDQSYMPKTWDGMDDTWHTDAEEQNIRLVSVNDPTREVTLTLSNPGSYFGMIMASGNNFKRVHTGSANPLDSMLVAPVTVSGTWDSCTVVTGNEHVNSWSNFSSAQVSDATNALPEMDIYVTYGNKFNHTIVGYVTFTLDEYVAVPRRQNYDGDEHTAPEGPGHNYGPVRDGDPSTPEIDTIWLDSNLLMPINVQITISTILEDFSNMANNVLAMYNEGRSNVFSRKIVLPATLEKRELYLTDVEWAPTSKDTLSASGVGNGDWTLSRETGDWFELTSDSASVIGTHNKFRMTIKPSDNITNTLATASGWHNISVQEPLDLVTATGQTGSHVISAGTDHYEGAHTAAPVSGTYGRLIGELDGHGEAALDVNLNFDGNHVYDKVDGKGYIGKVIMTFKSYAGSAADAATNPSLERTEFTLTIYVKSRAIGDTLYVASAPTVTRAGTTLNGHNFKYYSDRIGDEGAGNIFVNEADFKARCGKLPSLYLTNIKDAFNERIYEEGDVLCVLDTVKITPGEPLLIKGFDYMDVPVVRYDGHHHELPGEAGVYRGTMIKVSGSGASFSARFITFRGGLLSKIEPKRNEADYNTTTHVWASHDTVYNPIPGALDNARGKQKFADTNIVYGPIIAVNNGGTVALQNGVTVELNYNGYKGNDKTRYGAIHVGTNGTLTMINNVTVRHNLCDTIVNSDVIHNDVDDVPWKIHPYNGAIIVDGGHFELLGSNATTAMKITDNYVCGNDLGRFWKKYEQEYDSKDRLLRYNFYDTTSATKSNVLLLRQPNTSVAVQDTSDTQSELIFFSSTLPAGTRIGVSKWFPDIPEVLRDTIQIVFQSSGTHLAEAVQNGNFLSDDGYYVMYNEGVNVQRIYLQRCATFKHQVASNTPFIDGILPKDVLEYNCMANVNCPSGGDTIVYRVQGGFYPYTYKWSGENSLTHTTAYTSNEIKKQVKNNNFNGVRCAIADTLITSNITLGTLEKKKNITFRVEATDASGNCTLHKDIDITLLKSIADNPVKLDLSRYDDAPTTADNAFTDTDTSHHARATRQYKTVQITPKVWASPYSGTIQSVVYDKLNPTSDYYVFLDNGDGVENHHSLSDVYFCEGEVIKLATTPQYAGSPSEPVADFVMWDFDPYYSPTATFVVPTANRDVVAYYSPREYWKNHINTPAKGGVAYDNTYTYASRPTVASYELPDGTNTTAAGYVTTYNGDVHIYNENGLAWFISVVNGLNLTQAREFFFNKVYLHQKDGGYDMKYYKWSPVGNRQHPFRGWFQGVSSDVADTARLANGQYVTIKNIILNEPEMNNVGFFGFLDSARVYSIKLNGAMARGSVYVGTLAASSTHTQVQNCVVEGDAEGPSTNSTTILTTHYVSGGMIGESDHDRITNSSISAKYVGDAVYSGGVIGYGTSSSIVNDHARNDSRMSGLYVGGLAGYLNGTAPVSKSLFRKAKSGDMSTVRNNYVRLESDGNSQRVGGIVGQSANTIIENNYVYGMVAGSATDGAVGAVLNNGTRAENNYYEYGSTKRVSGQMSSGASESTTASFEGSGNRVNIDQQVYGVNNMTRVLNIWVNEHNAAEGSEVYKTWRSDLVNANHGYPVFGNPDMIPVENTITLENCDTVEWEGVYYTVDTSFSYNIIDSILMIDSTTALNVIVHHSTTTSVSDSIDEGDGYSGYGFYLTPAETTLMHNTLDSAGAVTIVLSDTLTTSFGCDSVVTLNLTINAKQGVTEVTRVSTVKVYPNPTTSYVTVEADELKHVELYDNEGRRLADYVDAAGDKLTVDLDRLSTGVYYLRIHTSEKVTIQKVIKK